MPLYPSKVLRAMERAPTPYSSIVFTSDSHLSLLRNLGAHQNDFHNSAQLLNSTLSTAMGARGLPTFKDW